MASLITLAAPTDAGRSELFRVQRILWAESHLSRVQTCGKVSVSGSEISTSEVAIKVSQNGDQRRAGFSGLATCGSVWSCPTCNQKIAAARAVEIGDAVEAWEAMGGHVVLGTYTMHHVRGQSITDLWDALGYAWSKATSGRGWSVDVQKHGALVPSYDLVLGEVAGAEPIVTPNLDVIEHPQGYQRVKTVKRRIPWVKAVEATYGKNGWHLHVHSLIFLRGKEVDAQALGRSMFDRWSSALVRKGLRAPVAHLGGLDVKLIEGKAAAMKWYLTKNQYEVEDLDQAADGRVQAHAKSAGFEVAYGAMKDGRRGNRAPFKILRDVVETGDAQDLAVWHEWELGSRGRRQIAWSKGFRQMLQLEEEKTDQELAEETLDGEVVQRITAEEWRTVRHRKGSILRAAELLPRETLDLHPVSTWLLILDAMDGDPPD